MSILTEYKGAKPHVAAYSPSIWANCPIEDFRARGGALIQEDQFDWIDPSAQRYTIDETDTGSISLMEADAGEGGILRLANAAVDNDELNFRQTEGAPMVFNSGQKNWHETVFRVSSVADNVCGIAFGYFEPGTGGTGDWQADNTAALPDDNYVALRTLQADGDDLQGVYLTAGGTEVATTGVEGTLTADTWHGGGWYFDGTNIFFYLDATLLNPGGTALTATDFPDTLPLQYAAGCKAGSAVALNFDIACYRTVVEYDIDANA